MWRKYFSLSRLKNTFDYWQHQEQYRVLWKDRSPYSQDGLHSFHSLEYFWPKLVPGGIIILDDYGYGNNQEQKWAHDTWAASKRIKILPLPTGQGLIMKNQASDDGKAAA